MANRFPLTLNKTTKKLEELPSGETLDLTGCGIVGATNAEFSGTVEANEYLLAGSPLSTLVAGDWNTLANKPTALSQFVNDVGFITQDADEQNLGLIGSELSIENGNTIDLSTLFELDLTDNILSIAGNSNVSVDLSGLEGQTLSLSGNFLTISNGNTVDLSTLAGGGGASTDTLDDVLARGNESLFPITVGALNTDAIYQTGTGVATITGGSNIVLNAAEGAGEVVVNGSRISNLGNPLNDTDAVTKQYVDNLHSEAWVAFNRGVNATNSATVNINGYFTDPNSSIISVTINATNTSNEVLVSLNAFVENVTDNTIESQVALMRSVNGGAYAIVKNFIFPPANNYYGGVQFNYLDVYTGVNVGDTIQYRLMNNMGDGYSGEDLRLVYGICGDTFGAREV